MTRFWGPTGVDYELAREQHPERFAPDGTPLIDYPGSSWSERLAAWTAGQMAPPASGLPATVPPGTEYDDEPPIPDGDDLDSPYARVREASR